MWSAASPTSKRCSSSTPEARLPRSTSTPCSIEQSALAGAADPDGAAVVEPNAERGGVSGGRSADRWFYLAAIRRRGGSVGGGWRRGGSSPSRVAVVAATSWTA